MSKAINGLVFSMSEECGICYEEFTIAATTSCLHTVCYSCFLRNRVLCGRKSCLLCSDLIKNAIIYKKESLSQEEIQKQLNHNHRYKNYEARYISRYHAIVTTDVMGAVNLLDLPPCPVCGHHPNNKHDLQEHVRKEHELEYCRVCVANKPSFMSDQLVYNRESLRKHLAQHPQCPLCRKPQYDNDTYKDHLLTDHHRCEICREHGVNDSYWRTANELIEHHQNDHFVCTSPACKTVMVAFGTKDELLAHQVNVHPEMFTQRELEDNQMRLFCGVSPDSGPNSIKQRRPKRRDVTNLIGLSQFSLNNRIQRGEMDNRGRFNNYQNIYSHNAFRIAEDAIFEMHTKLAIKNSLETARVEQMMREQDTDQALAPTDSQSTSIQAIYDPAIELIERNKEHFNKSPSPEEDRPPALVGSMALPGPDYKQENINIYDSLPTATQATLDRLLNKKNDSQGTYSSASTVLDVNTPTPLSHAELLQRTHERFGIVVKHSKKKKAPPAPVETVEASPSMGRDYITNNNNNSDDLVQVQDLGVFYGVSKHGDSSGAFDMLNEKQQERKQEKQEKQEKPSDLIAKSFPVDTNSNAKTSVQASLELYQKASANNTNNQQRPNQICGIPVVYKKKKKSSS